MNRERDRRPKSMRAAVAAVGVERELPWAREEEPAVRPGMGGGLPPVWAPGESGQAGEPARAPLEDHARDDDAAMPG
jgi:hypothetical protein